MTTSVPVPITLTRYQMLFLLHLLLFIVMAADQGARDMLRTAWQRIDPKNDFPFVQYKVWLQLESWFQNGYDDSSRNALKRAQKAVRLQRMIEIVQAGASEDQFLFDDLWQRVDSEDSSLPPVYDNWPLARGCIQMLEMHLIDPHGQLATYRDWAIRLFEEPPEFSMRAPEQPGLVGDGSWFQQHLAGRA